jgi:hypothetical protein
MSKRREREITMVLPPAIWNALQAEIAAEGLRGAHGAKNTILLRWIAAHLRSAGKLAGAHAASAETADDTSDEEGWGYREE